MIPTKTPSKLPSNSPSTIPSLHPTEFPTKLPSGNPTSFPSDLPSYSPTIYVQPTTDPTSTPSVYPSMTPTVSPSMPPIIWIQKTESPFSTRAPAQFGSVLPELSTSQLPITNLPSTDPTDKPTLIPRSEISGVMEQNNSFSNPKESTDSESETELTYETTKLTVLPTELYIVFALSGTLCCCIVFVTVILVKEKKAIKNIKCNGDENQVDIAPDKAPSANAKPMKQEAIAKSITHQNNALSVDFEPVEIRKLTGSKDVSPEL